MSARPAPHPAGFDHAVVSLLRVRGPLPVGELAAALGADLYGTRVALRRLARRGCAVRNERAPRRRDALAGARRTAVWAVAPDPN